MVVPWDDGGISMAGVTRLSCVLDHQDQAEVYCCNSTRRQWGILGILLEQSCGMENGEGCQRGSQEGGRFILMNRRPLAQVGACNRRMGEGVKRGNEVVCDGGISPRQATACTNRPGKVLCEVPSGYGDTFPLHDGRPYPGHPTPATLARQKGSSVPRAVPPSHGVACCGGTDCRNARVHQRAKSATHQAQTASFHESWRRRRRGQSKTLSSAAPYSAAVVVSGGVVDGAGPTVMVGSRDAFQVKKTFGLRRLSWTSNSWDPLLRTVRCPSDLATHPTASAEASTNSVLAMGSLDSSSLRP